MAVEAVSEDQLLDLEEVGDHEISVSLDLLITVLELDIASLVDSDANV